MDIKGQYHYVCYEMIGTCPEKKRLNLKPVFTGAMISGNTAYHSQVVGCRAGKSLRGAWKRYIPGRIVEQRIKDFGG